MRSYRTIRFFMVSLAFAWTSSAVNCLAKQVIYQCAPGQRMIYDIKITADTPQATETISGHAFYTVKSIDAGSEQTTLSFFANLSMMNSSRHFMAPVPFFGMGFAMPRDVVIDVRGNVVQTGEDEQLPFLLGNAWKLALEPTPPAGTKHWSDRNSILVQNRLNRFFPLPVFLDPKINWSAEQSVEYRVRHSDKKEITVEKKYGLTTNEKINGVPAVKENGAGQLVFDVSSGWVKSMDMKYDLAMPQENGASVTMPMTVHVASLGPDQARKVWNDRQEAITRSQKLEADKLRPRLLSNAQIDSDLEVLKDRDAFKIQSACQEMSHAVVIDSRRAQVVAALTPLLQDSESFVRVASVKAIAKPQQARAI